MKKTLFIIGFLLIGTPIFSCKDDGTDSEEGMKKTVNMIPEKKPVQLTDAQKTYVNACNDFTFNLFRQTNGIKESRILSPLSVVYVLGMLNDGADGETSREIMDVLGFKDADRTTVNEFCANLIENVPKVDPNVRLNIANALFVNKNITLLPSYVQDMKNYYQATVQPLDFSSSSAVSTVNNWCANQTDGLISEIIQETSPSALSCILNAICFKASWTDHFDPDQTTNGTFTKADGSAVNLPMMHRLANANITETENFKILCLPYSNWAFVMFVLLPNEGVTTDQIVENLTAETFDTVKKQIEPHKVEISMPRFTSSLNIDLSDRLTKTGIRKAFTDEAEFPFITPRNMRIDKIIQAAKIEVDEQGTKTSVVTVERSVSEYENTPREFHADHPFVYVIQELTSGAVFFVGTYMGD